MAYSRDNHYIAAYMRRHFDHVRRWSREGTLQWVKWFLCHGRSICLMNGRKLVGVVFVRLVDTPEQAAEHYRDTNGKIAYIEATACHPGMMKHLFYLFKQTFPGAEQMGWIRSKCGDRPTLIPMKRAETRLSLLSL